MRGIRAAPRSSGIANDISVRIDARSDGVDKAWAEQGMHVDNARRAAAPHQRVVSPSGHRNPPPSHLLVAGDAQGFRRRDILAGVKVHHTRRAAMPQQGVVTVGWFSTGVAQTTIPNLLTA